MQKARPHILFLLLILMVTGLFFSRAMLAVSIGVFTGISLIHAGYREHLYAFLKQPLCWGSSLIFFIPFISGLWSADKEQWLQMMQIKLPLILLPIAFAWPLGFSEKQWRWLILFIMLAVFGGCIYSLQAYFMDKEFIDQSYLEGRSLLTPLANDHVRFSLMVFVMIVWGGLQYYKDRSLKFSWLYLVLIVFFIAYLHILAARTGLLAFYLSASMLMIHFFLRLDRKKSILVFLLMLSLPLIAWFIFPSFKNKLLLFKHESAFSINQSYLPRSNDAVRVISLRVGWNILLESPFSGKGYGDIISESRGWYKIHYPEMKEEDMIYPSSQYLMMGAGVGIIGLIAFIMILLFPFLVRMQWALAWKMIIMGLAASYLFDIGLEVQYGVFLHCLILFLSWQWMKTQNSASL